MSSSDRCQKEHDTVEKCFIELKILIKDHEEK